MSKSCPTARKIARQMLREIGRDCPRVVKYLTQTEYERVAIARARLRARDAVSDISCSLDPANSSGLCPNYRQLFQAAQTGRGNQ